MIIRRYQASDCEETAELFYDTVHCVNAGDYTKEQLDAWATGEMDLVQWDLSLQAHYSMVAVEDEMIIGFGDIAQTGYLDRLYVHKDYQRQGVASMLCDQLEKACTVEKIVTHASITARPFFENRGYEVVRAQQVIRGNCILTNYLMEKRV